MRDRGLTLVEVLAAVVAVLMGVALLIPCFERASRHKRVEACRGRLLQLHRAMTAHYAENPVSDPDRVPLGGAFWTQFTRTSPPRVGAEVLRCPLVDAPGERECHYRGPGPYFGKLGEKDPLGCDEDRNHSPNAREGGNVLLRSGEVITDDNLRAEEGGVWGNALTRCRP